MPLRLIRRQRPDPLAGVPDADDLRELLQAMRDPALSATERFKARRHLFLHVQVMRTVPGRSDAVTYLLHELEDPPCSN